MTDRADIHADSNGFRRLSYTCRCGWIDWGHANGTGAAGLLARLRTGHNDWPANSGSNIYLNSSPAFLVSYTQRMGNRHIQLPLNTRQWIVKRGLSSTMLTQVAYTIFLSESLSFEAYQDRWVWRVLTDSGFSAEDLVSNMVGFYRALHGKSEAEMRAMCGDVGEAESLAIWDSQVPDGLGAIKNRTTQPIYFTTSACPGPQSLPTEFRSLQLSPHGMNWVQPRGTSVPLGIASSWLRYTYDSSGDFSISFN